MHRDSLCDLALLSKGCRLAGGKGYSLGDSVLPHVLDHLCPAWPVRVVCKRLEKRGC